MTLASRRIYYIYQAVFYFDNLAFAFILFLLAFVPAVAGDFAHIAWTVLVPAVPEPPPDWLQ